MKRFLIILLLVGLLMGGASIGFAQDSKWGATLYMGPATGSFTTGSTFTISFYVDTGGKFINAVETKILFPPDKVQVISPSTGSSFINVWAIQPSYSNTKGTLSFRGAVPSPGVNTDSGLISTVTFRVKSVGDAVIRFSDDSRILLNDGLGTDILQQKQSGVYRLTLPPPAGPIVASQTHPDQTRWYKNTIASLSWAGDFNAGGYSYVLNDSPIDIPDDISDGVKTHALYKNLSSGRHYFHIRALRAGVWGGTTHFALNVDSAPPAQFPIEVIPASRTSRHEPVIKFLTTDTDSGVDYYEIKIVGLSVNSLANPELLDLQQLFIESESPYVPPYLDHGAYDVIVRAYDRAGNMQEVTERMNIVSPILKIVRDEGVSIKELFVIPWWMIWLFAVVFLVFLGIIAWRLEEMHKEIHSSHVKKELPDEVSSKLATLREYQKKYGKMTALVLLTAGLLAGSGQSALANYQELPPPVITEVSRNIFNDEIFYAGGRTAEPETEVIIFLQSLQGGSTISQRTISDKEGRWFYRHSGFLPGGNYVLWSQAKEANAYSPPSPQISMTVASHAIQIGASRVTYTYIYLVTILVLIMVLIALILITLNNYRLAKQKHKEFKIEVQKAEESIRRGFALLRRDIEGEFEIIREAKMSKELSEEERLKEEEIMRDLDSVKRHIGEEVWELEKKGA